MIRRPVPRPSSAAVWRRASACAALLLLLAGCAPSHVPWTHPSLPKEQWGRDLSGCRRLADREVGWRDDEGASSPLREYDRQQARAQFNGAVAGCMGERGYLPAGRPAARPEGRE